MKNLSGGKLISTTNNRGRWDLHGAMGYLKDEISGPFFMNEVQGCGTKLTNG